MSNATDPIDWRTLSEQTGYRVLTFPDGSTLNSSEIVRIRIAKAEDNSGSGGLSWPRRVLIERTSHSNLAVCEDVDAVFEMATAAHRQWGGRHA